MRTRSISAISQKRAEEATRFKAKEIEKLEDRELEVHRRELFFDDAIGERSLGRHLRPRAGPAARHQSAYRREGADDRDHATQHDDDAKVFRAPSPFRSCVDYEQEGWGIHVPQGPLCIDLNDRINLTDVGAAMMRGFDLPSFRKDILREIRQTKDVPSIEQFWGSWLHELSNAMRTIEATFREILDIDGNQEAGILPMRVAAKEEARNS